MKRASLAIALLIAIGAPAYAFPTGVEVPTMTWPEPVVSQSCADPATVAPATCIAR